MNVKSKLWSVASKIDFHPKLFSTFKSYNKATFISDFMAGVIVAVVAALPLAIAFAIASGVTPEKGIITAIIGGFIVAAFGGTNVQIAGPTGAFIVIISGVVVSHGPEGLVIATALSGIMLLIMGIFKMGVVIRFIPYPVVIGFTGGIAVTIFTSQIKDFLGLHITDTLPSDFISKWSVYIGHIDTINFWALGIGILSILIVTLTPKITKKLPGSLIAILIITIASYFLRNNFGIDCIETIGDRFTINPSIPAPHGFVFNMSTVNDLLPVAFTIAILGAIESLLTATVADGMTGDRHNSNTELMALGAANVVVPIFGGIPVTGAMARTMTNINNGGKTPVAGIVHAVVLLLILLFLSPMTKHIPMACLAGVLVVVSYNMSGWRSIWGLRNNPRADVIVLVTTLVLTILLDLTIAIGAGLIMAVILFMKRIMENTNISIIKDQIDMNVDSESNVLEENIEVRPGVEVYEIDGPFFFGVANKLNDVMRESGKKAKVRIIRMRKVPFIDSTGLHNLENLIKTSQKENIVVILSGVIRPVKRTLIKAHMNKLIGSRNICDNIHMAVERANIVIKELEKSNPENQ